jgi:effector-binding domain-containing protein
MGLSIEVKDLPPQQVVRIRARVPSWAIEWFHDEAYRRLFTYLESLGAHPVGPPFSLYHNSVTARRLDLDFCVPITTVAADESGVAPGNLALGELPGGTFASTVFAGNSEYIGEAYARLMIWITENQYRLSGPCREVYLASLDRQDSPSEWITEILFPVTKAA